MSSLWEDCCIATGGATLIMTGIRLIQTMIQDDKQEEPVNKPQPTFDQQMELELKRLEIEMLKTKLEILERESISSSVCGY